jgi:hypothetical protein
LIKLAGEGTQSVNTDIITPNPSVRYLVSMVRYIPVAVAANESIPATAAVKYARVLFFLLSFILMVRETTLLLIGGEGKAISTSDPDDSRESIYEGNK